MFHSEEYCFDTNYYPWYLSHITGDDEYVVHINGSFWYWLFKYDSDVYTYCWNLILLYVSDLHVCFSYYYVILILIYVSDLDVFLWNKKMLSTILTIPDIVNGDMVWGFWQCYKCIIYMSNNDVDVFFHIKCLWYWLLRNCLIFAFEPDYKCWFHHIPLMTVSKSDESPYS